MQRALFLILALVVGSAILHAQDGAAALFRSNCANCHNANGDGKTAAGAKMKIPDLRSADVQKLSDELLYQTIANGELHKQYPHMFLRKGLREAQIRGLVGHVRTLKAKN